MLICELLHQILFQYNYLFRVRFNHLMDCSIQILLCSAMILGLFKVSLSQVERPWPPKGKICNSKGILCYDNAVAYKMLFFTGTQVSSAVCQINAGGVFSFTNLSQENLSMSLFSKGLPSKFSKLPLW